MYDPLLIHELGARHVRWRYDDPSGVGEMQTGPARPSRHVVPPLVALRLRVRRPSTPRVP